LSFMVVKKTTYIALEIFMFSDIHNGVHTHITKTKTKKYIK